MEASSYKEAAYSKIKSQRVPFFTASSEKGSFAQCVGTARPSTGAPAKVMPEVSGRSENITP